MDIRVIRTKKMLHEALLGLLAEKPAEKITPTELCREATINRNTFYSHYQSTAEVLDEIENELLTDVDSSIHGSGTPVEAITSLCEMMRNNKKLCTVLFSNNRSTRITQKAFAIADRFNLSRMQRENNRLTDNYRQMLSGYTIHGSAAVLEYWVRGGMAEEPRDIAEFIYSVSKFGTSSMTK